MAASEARDRDNKDLVAALRSIDNPVHALEVGRIGLDEQIVALGADTDVEKRFEMFEVLVVGAEQRLDPFLRNGNPLGSACLSQFISLLHN